MTLCVAVTPNPAGLRHSHTEPGTRLRDAHSHGELEPGAEDASAFCAYYEDILRCYPSCYCDDPAHKSEIDAALTVLRVTYSCGDLKCGGRCQPQSGANNNVTMLLTCGENCTLWTDRDAVTLLKTGSCDQLIVESESEGNTHSMLPDRTHIVCDAKASAARRRACAAMAWS